MEKTVGRIDGWTDDHVDYAINLLVRAERALASIDPALTSEITRFLEEMA